MNKKKQVSRLRNLLHDHPLMRKGGVHDKTNKQKRTAEKQQWKKEWGSLNARPVCFKPSV